MQSLYMHLLKQLIWGLIWKHIVEEEKNQTNAISVTLHTLTQAIWGLIWKQAMGKDKQKQPVWLCIFSNRQF